MSLGIPEPTVALFAVLPMLVVVHPESPCVAHVFPVKPLMQTQLQDRSALGIATPPFWQLMIPLHWPFWLVPGAPVGCAGLTVGVAVAVPWVSWAAVPVDFFILGRTTRTMGIMTAAATRNSNTIKSVTNVHRGMPQHLLRR